MRSLLIIAHGSQNPHSNAEIFQLCQSFNKYDHHYDEVMLSFLEFATPTIQQGIKQLVEKSAQQMNILPYFLAAGNHVIKDIPQIIDQAKEQYPNVEFNVFPHIGGHPQQVELILQHLNHY